MKYDQRPFVLIVPKRLQAEAECFVRGSNIEVVVQQMIPKETAWGTATRSSALD